MVEAAWQEVMANSRGRASGRARGGRAIAPYGKARKSETPSRRHGFGSTGGKGAGKSVRRQGEGSLTVKRAR